MRAFRRALELGADALETDVHVTHDGVIVVSHDPDGARIFGEPARIADSSWAEVRAWGIPSLEEVVTTFSGVPINVDLKIDAAAQAVALLREAGAQGPAALASFLSSTPRKGPAL